LVHCLHSGWRSSELIVCFSFLGFIVLVSSIGVGTAHGLFFGHNMILSGNSSANNPRVASYDNNVYVVWTDNSSKGSGDIIYRKSTDKGTTFDDAENLSNNPGNSTDPLITAHRNNVYVIWTDDSTGNADITFRKSSDYGNNFNRTINLSRNNGSSVSPQLAAIDNNVYVVWTDDTRGNNDIDLKTSHDYGDTFSRTKPVSRSNGSSISPQLAVSDNHVYVVWTEVISHGAWRFDGHSTNISNSDIDSRASHDYGNNFNRTINLSRNNGSSVSPQLAAIDNNVYVVWNDDTTGKADINFRKSSDYGKKFAGESNLSENLTGSFNPKLAGLDREKIYVTWTAGTNDKSEVFFTATGDSGEHFDNALNLSRSALASDSAYMAAYQNDAYLVWVEADSSESGGDILFKRLSEVFFPRNTK
jgi:hypothetical protein